MCGALAVPSHIAQFFKDRDDEAEVVFGMVEGLLSSVDGLCAIVRARLNGDTIPVALMVQQGGGDDSDKAAIAKVALLTAFRGHGDDSGSGDGLEWLSSRVRMTLYMCAVLSELTRVACGVW